MGVVPQPLGTEREVVEHASQSAAWLACSYGTHKTSGDKTNHPDII